MITHIKIRLCMLVIAFATSLGFLGSMYGMQKAEKRIEDPNKYYLLCNGDMHCVQSYFSGSGKVGSEEMLASSQGKHIWDIAPISQLHWTEKRKLKQSIALACRDTAKIGCELIVSSKLRSFIINANIKPVKCFNTGIGFLIKYSIIFSNRTLKIPGRSIESEESSEEGRELGRGLRDLPSAIEWASDEVSVDGEECSDDHEARLPFGFSLGCESESDQ
jgi:hypothetical protein